MAVLQYHRPTDRMTTGTLSLPTGTARTGYGLTALEDSDPSAPLWITGTSIRVVKDQLTALRVDHVYILAHNLVNAADPHFQMHTSDSWATPDVDIDLTVPTAEVDGFAYNLHADVAAAYPSAANRTKRYWSFANLSANSATVYIGEIWVVGSARVFTRTLNWGLSQPRQRLTSRSKSKRGVSTVYDYGTIERRLTGVLQARAQDFTDLRALEADAHGDALPFVVVLSPGNAVARDSEPLYVRLASSVAGTPQQYLTNVPVDLDFEELGRGELLGA